MKNMFLYRPTATLILVMLFTTGFSQQPSTPATRPRSANGPAPKSDHPKRRPELSVVLGHSGPVTALAFSSDEQMLASGDGGGAIKLWDAKTGEGLSLIAEANNFKDGPGVGALAFSSDQKLLAAALVVTEDITKNPNPKSQTKIGIWDLSSGRQVQTLSGLDMRVDTLVFSPDGKMLASGGGSKTITLWDVASAKVSATFTGKTDVVNVIRFSTDGTEITSGNWGISLTAWKVSTGMLVREIPGSPKLQSYQLLLPVFFHTGPIFNYAVDRFALLPGNRFEVSSGSSYSLGTVVVREWPSLKTVREFKQDNNTATSLAFSSSGRLVASGNSSGDIRIWDVDSGVELATIKEGFSTEIITMSVDNKLLAQVSGEGQTIRLWDTANETTVKELTGHTAEINTLAFSPDSKILASGSDDATIRLWDLQNGEVRVINAHDEHSGVGAIVFHPSGRMLASVAYNIDYEGENDPDNTIKLWKTYDGSQVAAISDPSIPLSLSFSPDGQKLAVGNYDGTVLVFETSSQKPIKSLKSTGKIVSLAFLTADMIQSLGLSQDDTTGQFDFWNVSTGQLTKTFTINENTTDIKENIAVGSFMPFLAISEQFYAMPVKGNGISLFKRLALELDPFNQKELATLYLLEDNNWLVVTPDGLFDGTPAAWSRASWLFNGNMLDHVPVESFFNEFFHPGLLTDILAGKRPAAPANIANKDRRQAQLRLSLAAPVTTRDVTVKLEVSQAPAGARDIRLFRNGSLVKVWRGDLLKDRSSVVLEATLPIVAGENKLTAYAFNNDNIKSADVSLTITGADSLKRKGVIYILSVGVNEYENNKFNLRYAVADAQSFAAEIKTRQTTLNNYGSVELIQLNDRDATRAGILKSLTELTTKARPEDAVIVYFAGHGTAQENRFYLVPHDLGSPTETSYQTILDHSISDEDLGRVFEGMDAGQTALVIDACNSGQALESEEKRRGPMNSKGLAQLAYEKGMYILTAAQSYQAAKETSRLGHGYLTYALVEEGLKTNIADIEPKDGRVLLREWLKYATARVPQLQQQQLDLQESHGRQLDRIKFVESDSGMERNLQRPRVFYRRELESRPLVISISGETLDANVDTGARLSAAVPDTGDNSARGMPLAPGKGSPGGEPVTVNVRRHRFFGPLLQDGSFDISVNRLSMRFDNETYTATFDRIGKFEARSYGQSGVGLFIQGRFINQKGKEEKKEFKLFAPTAIVSQVLQGLTMVPIVSCFNCDAWTMNTVNLFNHLRSITLTR
jgi:WD40 repeat protein/uncharacterized caspase-like protein